MAMVDEWFMQMPAILSMLASFPLLTKPVGLIALGSQIYGF